MTKYQKKKNNILLKHFVGINNKINGLKKIFAVPKHIQGPVINDDDNIKTTFPSYFVPQSIASVYQLDQISTPGSSLRGTGITVAIVIAYHYPKLQTDFDSFCTKYNLPRQTLTIKNFARSTNKSWSQECCLDTQILHSVAPGARIMVVQAGSNSFADLGVAITYAVNNGASVISMSWGAVESKLNQRLINTFERNFSNKNVTFVASSGDSSNIVNYPSSSSSVVAVGGTRLLNPTTGLRTSEIPWSTGYSGAGNGFSKFITKPVYQNDISVITGNFRVTPDLSLVADPATGFSVCYFGKYYVFGGTSLSAPLFAGIVACVNQLRIANSKLILTSTFISQTPTNMIQTFMYNICKGPSITDNFYDNGIYPTYNGYDIATGIGSIYGNILVNSLAIL
jgi:subtilase family serine protease